jgi:hypothetical protein
MDIFLPQKEQKIASCVLDNFLVALDSSYTDDRTKRKGNADVITMALRCGVAGIAMKSLSGISTGGFAYDFNRCCTLWWSS